jgi:hypothetical protein
MGAPLRVERGLPLGTPLPQALPMQRPSSSLSAQEQLSDGFKASGAMPEAVPSYILNDRPTFRFA